jgi:hypothetical protein
MTMVELTNMVLMTPPTHVCFCCDPEIEAYIDTIFCEPEGFGHESADENKLNCSKSSYNDRDSKECHSDTAGDAPRNSKTTCNTTSSSSRSV